MKDSSRREERCKTAARENFHWRTKRAVFQAKSGEQQRVFIIKFRTGYAVSAERELHAAIVARFIRILCEMQKTIPKVSPD